MQVVQWEPAMRCSTCMTQFSGPSAGDDASAHVLANPEHTTFTQRWIASIAEVDEGEG